MGDWLEGICNLFQKEIELYGNLLTLELEKRNAINSADGRALQEITQKSYHFMVEASELERLRMKTIEEIYKTQNLEPSIDAITLTDFLNKVDRDSNFQLKGYATELKTTVHKLKDAIIINEKLIQTRQDLLQKTVSEMRKLDKEPTYTSAENKKKTNSKVRALVLNTAV
ncbi:MAG: flagellar protein FlgN [Leptospiraceae bacterium]|jgi:flagellar biosynthesis/type III secretory pathway chaperone|nr:flagellar protein FlgN [Leptospiraceae bacterium]MCZ8346996.1 flagellar protein FlgN [Leptospiraceae bacterium]PJE01020.1 MAG: flagellar biosynthesis protein FlgN [Leptospira sp.]